MTVKEIAKLLNDNQGVLGVTIFVLTIAMGWITGIFRSLIKKPKFKIRVIPKMTFGTVFLTGDKYTPPGLGAYDLNKTAFVLYLEITNVGSAASNLGKIQLGYYKDDGKSTLFQKRIWIKETNILDSFSIPTGDGQEVRIAHLRQSNLEFDEKYDGFLEVGKSILGAAYFEQTFSWGNHYPRFDEKGISNIRVTVKDAFGGRYSKTVDVQIKDHKECLRYNSRFGFTEHLFNKDVVTDKSAETEKEDTGGVKDG